MQTTRTKKSKRLVETKSRLGVSRKTGRTEVTDKRNSRRNGRLIYQSVVTFVLGHYLQNHVLPPEYYVQVSLKLKADRVADAFKRMRKQGIIRDEMLNLHFWNEKFIAQICVLSIPSNGESVMTLLHPLKSILSQSERKQDEVLRLSLTRYVQIYGFEHVKRQIQRIKTEGRRIILSDLDHQMEKKFKMRLSVELNEDDSGW